MNKILIALVALVAAGCSTQGPTPSPLEDFRESAEQCSGAVTFEAKLVGGETSARYRCDWEQTDEW